MAEAKQKLTEGPVMRHVTVMSFTSSIGIMAIYVVDLLDIFFVSLLGHQEIAAAAGYASTLLFLVSAVNIGVSIGAGALIARELGADRDAQARIMTTTSAMIAVILGIALPILMYPALPLLVGLLGAEGEVAALAQQYLRIVLPATALSGMSMVFVAAIRANGAAGWAMYPALAGALVNLVFDPLLIFGLNMELAGAATATVMARCATCAVAFYAVARKFALVTRPELSALRENGKEILAYAFPALVANVAAPVGLAIITRYITKFGPEAVAGMAVIGRLSPVVFSVVNALSGAIGAIIGQNYGAARHDRVREAYFGALKFLAIYVAIAMVLLFTGRELIADAFSAEGKTRALIYIYCGPFAMIAFFNGALFVANAAFGNLGHPSYAPRLNWAKNTVGLVPFVALGTYFFGVHGLAYGLMANAAVFALAGHILTMRIINALPEAAKAKPDADFEEDQRHIDVEHGKPLQI